MSTIFPINNLAIMEQGSLARLGIEQYVLALDPEMRCTLRTDSVANLCQQINPHSLSLIVSELAGLQESEQQGWEGLMQLAYSRPDIRQIIYTYSYSGERLHALHQFSQVSLISRKETSDQTSFFFSQALAGCKVCSPLVQLAIAEHSRGIDLITRQLTICEHKVLGHLFCGLSLTETAKQLSRSIKTVSAHKRNAMGKLGVHDDVELFSFRHFFYPLLNECVTSLPLSAKDSVG